MRQLLTRSSAAREPTFQLHVRRRTGHARAGERSEGQRFLFPREGPDEPVAAARAAHPALFVVEVEVRAEPGIDRESILARELRQAPVGADKLHPIDPSLAALSGPRRVEHLDDHHLLQASHSIGGRIANRPANVTSSGAPGCVDGHSRTALREGPGRDGQAGERRQRERGLGYARAAHLMGPPVLEVAAYAALAYLPPGYRGMA
jgi:hypothetical protein